MDQTVRSQAKDQNHKEGLQIKDYIDCNTNPLAEVAFEDVAGELIDVAIESKHQSTKLNGLSASHREPLSKLL